jgi:RNA polymerase sigma factor (TIGR02999 family)
MPAETDITQLLRAWGDGKPVDQDRLLSLVYQQLRGLADRIAHDGRPIPTLHPTALVHEAYLKLARDDAPAFAGQKHFFAVAARAMRQIIADHARTARRHKRGGGRHRVTLDPEVMPTPEANVDVVALNDACECLAALDARQAHIVELHFFAGLSLEEIAPVLGVSETTVRNDWRGARAWLRRELSRGESLDD